LKLDPLTEGRKGLQIDADGLLEVRGALFRHWEQKEKGEMRKPVPFFCNWASSLRKHWAKEELREKWVLFCHFCRVESFVLNMWLIFYHLSQV